jgi:MoxR-like ATPase
LIGTMIYNPAKAEFTVKKGPVFANIILADEINRAPAKVQSALLEAMQERQVTIGDTSYKLDEPFLVLATQNPIEQEGTYPLPEAQIDRFMLMLKITYPNPAEEREIMDRNTSVTTVPVSKVISPEDIIKAREVVRSIYVDEKIKEYIINIVFATREPNKYGLSDLSSLIAFGGSPRATIYLNLAAKAHAFLKGRGYVTPEDIKAIGADVLRHRVLLTYEAEAEEISSDDIVRKVFDTIEVP